MRSLLLDRERWDLVLDSAGNMAVCENPYATAQDVACAVRLFAGELWYDTAKGIPYFDQILGKFPPVQYMKARFVAAALAVPDVASAQCFISSLKTREVTGQIQVTDTAGTITAVSIAPKLPSPAPFILDQSALDGPDVLASPATTPFILDVSTVGGPDAIR